MPTKTTQSGPRDFFLYFFVTVTLFASVISFISLVFQYINYAFPDQLNYYLISITQSIRWSTAFLIVAFPIFLYLSYLINRDIKKNPAKKELRVRKWLLSLTLSAAGAAIAADLISLIYNYLGGDLTTQFALKILTVLLVALGVFMYFLWDIRGRTRFKSLAKIAAIKSSVIVLAAIIAGFFIVGSPAQQRDQRFDELRISHLQSIEGQIISYWQSEDKLPTTLQDITQKFPGFIVEKDPETNQSYDYHITGQLSFELCGNFATDANDPKYMRGYPTYPYGHSWDHAIGNQCFSTTIDPKLYPKIPDAQIIPKKY